MDALERMVRIEELRAEAAKGRAEVARPAAEREANGDFDETNNNAVGLIYKEHEPAPPEPTESDWVGELLASSEFIDMMGRVIAAERKRARKALLESERGLIERQHSEIERLNAEIIELRVQVNTLVTLLKAGGDAVIDLKNWRRAS